MSGVILEPRKVMPIPARQIVVAPRLPELLKDRYQTPFEAEGDLVADCDLCGYHAMGPRRQVGAAMREHHRLFHPEETGVVLLNTPRQ